MTNVVVVGCGIVGATIAYELSKIPDLTVTVFDQQPTPVEPDLSLCPTSTGAALGVLMGVISKKEKGNNLRMRLESLQYYEKLIPELETLTGLDIPFNRSGILMLQFEEDLSVWEKLIEIRRSQGWTLEILGLDRLNSDYPYLNLDLVTAAIYSPDDRQVNPVALTQALIAGAKQRGVTFQFGTTMTGGNDREVHTTKGNFAIDWLIISAGLGSTAITQSLAQPIDIRPVLGQAIHLRLNHPLGLNQPVITGNDVHLVPLGNCDYWVGATVEFPSDGEELAPDAASFKAVMQQAIAFCPDLANAETIRTWHGSRPRPQGRPAPIIERLSGYQHILLATGHYRNGVLLAPATAEKVRLAIEGM